MSDRVADVLDLLRRLDAARIYFDLARPREDALMIIAVVPGERWEIEYMEDGTVEIEVFRSDGEIKGPEALSDLFRRFAD